MKKKNKFFFLTFLLVFFLIEFFLRILNVNFPIFQKHDEITGFSLLPNTKGIWNREGEGLVSINSQGLRDIEHSFIKNENTLRIAILGDSFAEARSVNLEDTFWKKLENNLNNCLNKKYDGVEVINFGVTEYSTAQEYLTLKNKVWNYNPDIVLLAFYSGNDIRDNSKKLSLKKYRPFFVLDENQQLILDESFKSSKPYVILESNFGKFFLQISKYSKLAQLFRELYVRNYLKVVYIEDQKNDSEKINLNEYAYNQEDWSNAWNITEKLLLMINKEVISNKSKFYILTVTTPIQVHPNENERLKFKEKFKITNIDYPEERILNFGKENGISIISLSKSMRTVAIKKNIYYHGFSNTKLGIGHWNEKGHDFASREVTKIICRDLLIK